MIIARKNHLDTLAVSLLIACCAFWGLQQILIKTTVTEVPPLWQASIRMAGAVLLLWLWCLARGVKLFERDGTLPAGLLAGALFAGEFTCIYIGLQHTTRLAPDGVPLHLALRGGAAAAALRAVGAAARRAVGGPGASRSPAWWWPSARASATAARSVLHGDALALLAGVLWGLTTLAIRTTKLATASAEKTLFYQIAVTAAVTPFLSLLLGETWQFAYSGYAWLSIGLQTVIGAFASYLAWMWMLRHYPATRISSFTFLTPLFALVFGVALLKEPLTAQLVLALAGVGFGILLVNRRS